ncbi:class II glutamine amidotransferase [Thermodesulfovibrio yellowstonii]|uniref:class II glutamine amidotransferase n=1 Tax=Thermodesulfovibrio yellowstonii TaxID=28262 RepID=UPI0005706A7C|nr:class II glutamine amidotransferase [Thermodesulfovibrio islandicus]
MCELLGMCFNKEVNPSISFRGFRRRDKDNPHGWGIAFYPDESALVYKEPVMAIQSRLSEFLRDYDGLKSKIFIGHVRLASVGKYRYKNTHPFQRELNGKDFVFAHNGTLRNFKEKLKLGRFRKIGDTDSEHAFCYLLGQLEEKGINFEHKDDFDFLAKILRQINDLGKFNCIFSDGRHLFCYHDKNSYNGLVLLKRTPPYGPIRLRDEDWEINLAEEKDPTQHGYIIATKPLTNENWERFKPGELKVFKEYRDEIEIIVI